MKTYNKAQEIFSKKLTSSFVKKSQKSSINILKYTSNSTTKLYQLYLTNKFFKNNFKTLYNTFILSKKRKYLFLSAIKKITFLLNKIRGGIKTKKVSSWLKANIKKDYSRIIFYLLIFIKNSELLKSKQRLKSFLLTLKWLVFSSCFPKKVFFQIKLKRYITVFKSQLKTIKNFKFILEIKSKLKGLSSKYLTFLKNLLINYRWSNRSIIPYGERISKTLLIYGIPLIILIYTYGKSLCLLENLTTTLDNSFDHLDDSFKRSYVRNTKTLVTQISKLFPTNKLKELLLKLIQFVEKSESLSPYISALSVAYIALTLSAKNRSMLPKSIGKDIVIGTSFVLINFVLERLQTVFTVLKNCSLSFIDIYFYKVFLGSEKKVEILTHITQLLTNEVDKNGFNAAKIWRRATIVYDTNLKAFILALEPSYKLGRYEEFTKVIVGNYYRFLASSFYTPIYLILIFSLLYNWCYYVIYNKRPYLPLITELADKLTPPKFTD